MLFQLGQAGGGLFDNGSVLAIEIRLLGLDALLGLLENLLELLDLGGAILVALQVGQPGAQRLFALAGGGFALRLRFLQRGL